MLFQYPVQAIEVASSNDALDAVDAVDAVDDLKKKYSAKKAMQLV